MTYLSNNNNLFGNPLVNGYKWGSSYLFHIMDNYKLVFASESNVYASLGIVTWHFAINAAGKLLISLPSEHRTYSTATSGIAAGTGLNTVYFNGKYAVVRDS